MLFMIYGVLSRNPKLAQTRSMRESQENDLSKKLLRKVFPIPLFQKSLYSFMIYGVLSHIPKLAQTRSWWESQENDLSKKIL